MTSGEQCVMMAGTVLMPVWSADNWDMHTLEVSAVGNVCDTWVRCFIFNFLWSGGTPYNSGFFGVGTGPIYLDDVACTSSASQLLECPSRPILTHNCDHHADAGVGCEGI